jgi:hypothetical protein
MKLPRRKFLHLAAGVAALPAVARRLGASLSDAAGVRGRPLCRCRKADSTRTFPECLGATVQTTRPKCAL